MLNICLGIVLKSIMLNIASTLPMHKGIFDMVRYDIHLLELGFHPVAVLGELVYPAYNSIKRSLETHSCTSR